MRKLILSLLFLNFAVTEAKERLRAEEVVNVENGKVIETGILTDQKGTIFLEFLKGSFINYTKDRQPFSGDILPPSIIDKPEKFPRARMREILTFELLTDNADEVSLVDRYTLMHTKEYLRATLENPDGLIQTGGIKFLTRIYDKDKIGLPTLWLLETKPEHFKQTEVKYWKKIGGKLNQTSEKEVKVFSAILNRTGVYGVFDEDPSPYYSENTPLEAVQPVEKSPYPSVVPQSPELPIDNLNQTEQDNLDDGGPVSVNAKLIDPNANDEFDFPFNEEPLVIPAVESTTPTPIIPAVENDIKHPSSKDDPYQKDFNALPPYKNQMQASVMDVELLPVAGPDNGNNSSAKFPIILILSFAIFGFSIYLAVKKEHST